MHTSFLSKVGQRSDQEPVNVYYCQIDIIPSLLWIPITVSVKVKDCYTNMSCFRFLGEGDQERRDSDVGHGRQPRCSSPPRDDRPGGESYLPYKVQCIVHTYLAPGFDQCLLWNNPKIVNWDGKVLSLILTNVIYILYTKYQMYVFSDYHWEIFVQATFEKLENEMKEVNANSEALKRNFLELTELKHILRKTQTFFEEVSCQGNEMLPVNTLRCSDRNAL